MRQRIIGMRQCLPDIAQGLPEFGLFICIAIFTVTLASCTESGKKKSSASESTDRVATTIEKEPQASADILTQAEKKYEEAKELEHAWKATRAQIEIAREAIKENDQEKARVAANRALFTANASVMQALRGKEDWLTHVVK